jgi:hypothetical protein
LGIPDRSTAAVDFTVRFERSDTSGFDVEVGTVVFGTRDASMGRVDRLPVIL